MVELAVPQQSSGDINPCKQRRKRRLRIALVRGSSLSTGFMAFILGGMTTPLQAGESPNFMTQTLGSHTYAIPRDLIEMIYKPDYSGVANSNPNWSRDPVVRLALQWPEFTASTISDPQEKARRGIKVSMLEGTVMTVARGIERLNELNYSPEIIDAPYGLRELRSGLSKEFREYIASLDGGSDYLIHCSQPQSLTQKES